MTYFLVDTENVPKEWQPFTEDAQKDDVFVLFYSKNVAPVSMSLFGAASIKGVRFEFIECRVGANAMDFQLVTELGKLVTLHPSDLFVILSKDCGYDVVIQYWQDRNINIKREALYLNTPEQTIRHEYETLLMSLGLAGKELNVAADIFMRTMRLPQNARKIETYNSFQKHYGAKEGQERYRVVKDLVKDIAMRGPIPQQGDSAAKPVTAVGNPGNTPKAKGSAKAQQAVSDTPTVPVKKKLSVAVKEQCPALSKHELTNVTNFVNHANQHGGDEGFFMKELLATFKRAKAQDIFERTKGLLHPL